MKTPHRAGSPMRHDFGRGPVGRPTTNGVEHVSKNTLPAPIGQPDGPSVPLVGTCETCGTATAWLSGQCTACGVENLFSVSDDDFDDAVTSFFSDLNEKWQYDTTEGRP